MFGGAFGGDEYDRNGRVRGLKYPESSHGVARVTAMVL